MSENWHTANAPDEPTEGNAEGTAAPEPTPESAIALPPAGSDGGALYPTIPNPTNPQSELPPTGPTSPVTTGAPTPPAGMGTPVPPGSWGAPHPQDPYAGGWTPGGWPGGGWSGGGWPPGATPPPYGGWPAPAYGPVGPPAAPPKKRTGLVATLATLVVVAALLIGAGVGRLVWTSGGTLAASPSNSGGSSGSGAFGGGSSSSGGSPFGGSSSGSSSGNSSTGAGAPSDISSITAKVDPGLVDINTNLSYENEQAAGTGMVLTSNGVILTNNHVIDGATSISVTDVGNGKTYSANVVGYDRTGDVAVIRLVNASGLQTVSVASGTAAVGQAVVGIGNAGGSGGTPSAAGGSITALDQSITASDDNGGNSENLSGLIEVNAGIEPGDSGGSLVNASGQVLGMDTAASEDSTYEVSGTQAYAIPIHTALTIAKQIEAGKATSVVHIGATGFLGVSVEASSTSGSSGNGGGSGIGNGNGDGGFGGGFGNGFGDGGSGSGSSGSTTSGATVEGTLAGSPAAKAGLVQGDVITGLNGSAITSSTDLSNALVSLHPGNSVQLKWVNTSGQTQTATVVLTSGPPS